jgi:hypothetical protein
MTFPRASLLISGFNVAHTRVADASARRVNPAHPYPKASNSAFV